MPLIDSDNVETYALPCHHTGLVPDTCVDPLLLALGYDAPLPPSCTDREYEYGGKTTGNGDLNATQSDDFLFPLGVPTPSDEVLPSGHEYTGVYYPEGEIDFSSGLPSLESFFGDLNAYFYEQGVEVSALEYDNSCIPALTTAQYPSDYAPVDAPSFSPPDVAQYSVPTSFTPVENGGIARPSTASYPLVSNGDYFPYRPDGTYSVSTTIASTSSSSLVSTPVSTPASRPALAQHSSYDSFFANLRGGEGDLSSIACPSSSTPPLPLSQYVVSRRQTLYMYQLANNILTRLEGRGNHKTTQYAASATLPVYDPPHDASFVPSPHTTPSTTPDFKDSQISATTGPIRHAHRDRGNHGPYRVRFPPNAPPTPCTSVGTLTAEQVTALVKQANDAAQAAAPNSVLCLWDGGSCGEYISFKNRSGFGNHLRRAHGVGKGGKVECRWGTGGGCGKEVLTEGLRKHVKSRRHLDLVVFCPCCGGKFQRTDVLRKHLEGERGDE
ncbi:hypothetical protein R3P38DRAFT_3460210 [Favolaschia claudopus]|uniref:C2H2-type domain-containing protein n=1 Tax=Favolaschia claudopus TaxID=2862362 RepID=A0AAV9ZGZ4_9AGAR